jgi:hypothetical protein
MKLSPQDKEELKAFGKVLLGITGVVASLTFAITLGERIGNIGRS